MDIEVYKKRSTIPNYQEYEITVPFAITKERVAEVLGKLLTWAISLTVEEGMFPDQTVITIATVSPYHFNEQGLEELFRNCKEAKGAKIKHMTEIQNYDWTSDAPYARGFNDGFDKGTDAAITVLASKIYPVKIIQNGPATIIFWKDGKKTVVKRKKGDKNDIDAAVAQAIAKRFYGSNSRFHRVVELAVKEGKGEKK